MQAQIYDVVVVGSGVAGAMTAWVLARNGARVLILEAGEKLQRHQLAERSRQSSRWDSMAPYPAKAHARHADPVGDPAYLTWTAKPYHTTYIRAAGGTTWHWGSASWRFLAKDFQLHSHYGVGRDWPLSYAELEPFYCEAEYEMGVAGRDIPHLDAPRSKAFPMPPPAFSHMDQVLAAPLKAIGMELFQEPVARNSQFYDQRPACCGNNNCVPICPIGAQYCADMTLDKALQAGADIRYNAVVSQLSDAADGSISQLSYLEPNGTRQTIQARYYVLAANAIESCKILLMSKTTHSPAGIANSSGLVGCNLMDHPHISAAFDCPLPVYAGRGPIGITGITQFMDGDFRRKMGGKKFSILNGNPLEAVSEELIDQGLSGEALDQAIRHKAVRRFSSYVQHEQLPHRDNRVLLHPTARDVLGLPLPVVHWQPDDYAIKSCEHSADLYRQMAKALGAEVHIEMHMGSDAHTLGTTIMGTNPMDSVVDANCCSHDHPNLYLNGGTVFSSGSTVNPTLTIAALALRLGHHLTSRLQRPA